MPKKTDTARMSDFVKRIDSLLQEKGLKRPALLKAVDVNPTAMTDWQRRGTVPSADTAVRIAKFLGTTVEYLVTGQEAGLPADIALFYSLNHSHKAMVTEMISALYNAEEQEAARLERSSKSADLA